MARTRAFRLAVAGVVLVATSVAGGGCAWPSLPWVPVGFDPNTGQLILSDEAGPVRFDVVLASTATPAQVANIERMVGRERGVSRPRLLPAPLVMARPCPTGDDYPHSLKDKDACARIEFTTSSGKSAKHVYSELSGIELVPGVLDVHVSTVGLGPAVTTTQSS
jgi:hypothetical protein